MKPLKYICILTSIISFFAFTCKKKAPCEGVVCTQEFRTVDITVVDNAGNAKPISSIRTIDPSTNAVILSNSNPNTAIGASTYTFFSDLQIAGMTANSQKTFKVEGVYNNAIVFTESYVISADCCHITKVSGKDSVVVP